MRDSFGQLWRTVSDTTRLDPVQIQDLMAYGTLLNTNAALATAGIDADWASQTTC
ncbi:hypothetical protein [Streptomyces cucumeris]|uniref:hypothetical protein n=1 Tax=Streptomyces cucumeris TaxID=2962890 RepID=UPI003D7471A4